ncbi:hydroxylysine kinase-like [Ciona intestinalis]
MTSKILREKFIRELVYENFNITVDNVTKLCGYEDENYFVGTARSSESYVLKIINKDESCTPDIFRGINEAMETLFSSGLNVPRPIHTRNKDTILTVEIDGSSHVIQLLSFIHGDIFDDVIISESNFYQVVKDMARFFGKMNKILQNSNPSHQAARRDTLWKLENFTLEKVGYRLKYVEDTELQENCHKILTKFETLILPKLGKFRRGLTHGDGSAGNIVLKKLNHLDCNETSYQFHGIIDFGDTEESAYVFELATLAAFMKCHALELGFNLNRTLDACVAGYQDGFPLNAIEIENLDICVKARLASYICSSFLYAHLDYENRIYIKRLYESASKILKSQ